MNAGFDWSIEKNQRLINERGVSFEDVVAAIERGGLLNVRRHSNQDRYPGQMVYYLEIDNYVYVVPLSVRDDGNPLLITIIPSRKATRDYLSRRGT